LTSAQPRLPLPWQVVCAWASALVSLGRGDMALAMVLAFDAYLRPCELLALKVASLLPPVCGASGTMAAWSLTVFSYENGRPSKTGHFNDSIVLDSPTRSFLGPLLARLQVGRLPSAPLFTFSYEEWARLAKAAVALAALEPLKPVLYQLRHSGPSNDVAQGARTLLQVKVRGRWASDSSVRRYEKHSQLSKQWSVLGKRAQTFATASALLMPNVLGGACKPPLLPRFAA
jgi:hypothetical protein